eukprot:TRINITY_DN5360_c0_g1_i2.p1 TRINITY_DN5360_c0_g1~~TRINITY_DN5360_c0_g1_i2.p1  ORF type:complete len:763 (-),score=125.27 TRINITY_DN5360_c0_g1_i2:74-2362(-)
MDRILSRSQRQRMFSLAWIDRGIRRMRLRLFYGILVLLLLALASVGYLFFLTLSPLMDNYVITDQWTFAKRDAGSNGLGRQNGDSGPVAIFGNSKDYNDLPIANLARKFIPASNATRVVYRRPRIPIKKVTHVPDNITMEEAWHIASELRDTLHSMLLNQSQIVYEQPPPQQQHYSQQQQQQQQSHTQHTQPRREVTITFADSYYRAYLFNWLIHLRKLNMSNYVIVATDAPLIQMLHEHGFGHHTIDATRMISSRRVLRAALELDRMDEDSSSGYGGDEEIIGRKYAYEHADKNNYTMPYFMYTEKIDVIGDTPTDTNNTATNNNNTNTNKTDGLEFTTHYEKVLQTRLTYLIWGLELGFDLFHSDVDVVFLRDVPAVLRDEASADSLVFPSKNRNINHQTGHRHRCDMEAMAANGPPAIARLWPTNRTINCGFYYARSRGPRDGMALVLRHTLARANASDQDPFNYRVHNWKVEWETSEWCQDSAARPNKSEGPEAIWKEDIRPRPYLACHVGRIAAKNTNEYRYKNVLNSTRVPELEICVLDEFLYMRRLVSEYFFWRAAAFTSGSSAQIEKHVVHTQDKWRERIHALHATGPAMGSRNARARLDKRGFFDDWKLWKVPYSWTAPPRGGSGVTFKGRGLIGDYDIHAISTMVQGEGDAWLANIETQFFREKGVTAASYRLPSVPDPIHGRADDDDSDGKAHLKKPRVTPSPDLESQRREALRQEFLAELEEMRRRQKLSRQTIGNAEQQKVPYVVDDRY